MSYVTARELRQLLRYLERKAHPQAGAAATLGSLRDDPVEAARTIIFQEDQAADGTMLVTYGDAYA